MKTTFKDILPALFPALFALLARWSRGGPEGPDQRRGSHVPLPHLLEVVRRIPQAASGRGDQLPVDRLGRRHPPAHERDGLLRRLGRADDERPARGRSARDPPLPDRPRRRRPRLQHPGRQRRAEVHGAGPRRDLSRQDHEVERPGDHEAESRREPPGDGYRGRTSVGRLGHDVHLGRLPLEDLSRVEEEGRRRDVRQLARRRRRQGERGRRRPRETDPGRDRLRRAHLRDPEQDLVRVGPEHGRGVRPLVARLRDRGGGRSGQGHAEGLSRLDHERTRLRRVSRSAPSPGCSSTRIRRTRSSRRSWSISCTGL